MYLVLRKGEASRKVQVIKEETYEAKPKSYKSYHIIQKTESWKDAQVTLRKIKRGEPLEDLPLPALPVVVKWEVPPRGVAFVYGLYDYLGHLIYIGVTGQPNLRAKNHVDKGKVFSEMRVLFSFYKREEAESFERFAIATLNPPVNVLVEGIVPGSNYEIGSLVLFGEVSKTNPKQKISDHRQKKRVRNGGAKKKGPRPAARLCEQCKKPIKRDKQVAIGNGKYVHLVQCKRIDEKKDEV